MAHVYKDMKNNILNKKISGFTLVELLVSSTLFTIVVVGGMSVLISSQKTYQKLSKNRPRIDNVNLVLSNISNNLQYGTNFICINKEGNFHDSSYYLNFPNNLSISSDNDCNSVVFSPQDSTNTKIIYYLNKDSNSINEADYILDINNNFILSKDTKLNSSDIAIQNLDFNLSTFLQPKIKIIISGNSVLNKGNDYFLIENIISQKDLNN